MIGLRRRAGARIEHGLISVGKGRQLPKPGIPAQLRGYGAEPGFGDLLFRKDDLNVEIEPGIRIKTHELDEPGHHVGAGCELFEGRVIERSDNHTKGAGNVERSCACDRVNS